MDPDRLMVTVGSRIPHLISERSSVVLGRVRFWTPRFWLGSEERTSLSGELDMEDRPTLLRLGESARFEAVGLSRPD